MGNKHTKSSLRNAIIYLNISADEISADNDKFWAQIFSEDLSVAEDVIRNITVQEIRMLRDGSPKNFATLAYKMVERLCLATGSLCNTQSQQTAVLNSVRVLMRMLPCMFEDIHWRHFLKDNIINPEDDSSRKNPTLKYPHKEQSDRDYAAYLPTKPGSRPITPMDRSHHEESSLLMKRNTLHSTHTSIDLLQSDKIDHPDDKNELKDQEDRSLMKSLILSICDLLFCPEFTVSPHGDSYLANAVDAPPEDLKSLSTYDYVWEPGVGFDSSINSTTYYDKSRSELLRAILVCLSMTLYETPDESIETRSVWIGTFVSQDNRHALPLFTSLLNVIFGYKPPRANFLQLNNLLFESGRERLVELSCQLLIAALDYHEEDQYETASKSRNLFIYYMSRIHREEDFIFLIKGFIRLMNYRLEQSYLWTPTRYIEIDQELQMLLWKICNLNKKFLQYLLASNELLEIVVPILYHLNENFQEASRTALIHIGIFNLLVLSGERNFGVRLNKPYTNTLLSNLPELTGTHADLMIVVFHKLIMYGYKINQLYDYLLTVLVNVSPYLKGMSMLACKCMMQLFETFSSVVVIFTEPNYHQLVISLLEIFNNLIQYQFDGNTNLVYMILAKKEIFINLANLSTSQKSIDKVLRKLIKRKQYIDQLSATNSKQELGDKNNNTCDREEEKKDELIDQGNLGFEDLDLSLAIVSCTNNIVNTGSTTTMRQEVSLVATPDLQHTTQPIHPFDLDIDNSASTSQLGDGNHMEANAPKIGLDDLLIEAEDDEHEHGEQALLADMTVDETRQQEQQAARIDLDSEICETKSEILDNTNNQDKCEAISTRSHNSNTESADHGDRWRPTSDWLRVWIRTLPLQTILRMICALEPQVQQFKRTGGKNVNESELIKFLQNGTLVGLLPVPHPIQIRKYRTNDRSTMWFRAYSWGIIYVRNSTWIGTNIRLIKIL